MKRILSLVVAIALIWAVAASAVAETMINTTENRGIKLQEVGLNEVEDGISPTTGLTLADLEAPDGFAGLAITGRYMPMLVQIDNDAGGVDSMAPWGASYADIIYETPLHKNGNTRLSFLFSDLIPDSVGPVRSARMGHVWIREEWDCGFLYYGEQKYPVANVPEELSRLGATSKGVLFSGTVGSGKAWKQYYVRRSGIASPHNVDANVAAMYELIPTDFEAPNHAFLFTDDMPEGDTAEEIKIKWGAIGYGSNLLYDIDSNLYFRYMRQKNDVLVPYEDRDTQEQIAFANVIVQFIEVDYPRTDAPLAQMIGEGNADFFMGGVHIAGYWKREDVTSRTVFYGPDGNEIALQRGKTLIVTIGEDKEVSYQ